MAVHYHVAAGETLAIRGPANIRVTGGEVPLIGDPGSASPPVLSGIDPDTAVAGDPDFVLTATGSDFKPSSVIVLGLVDVATVVMDDTTLTATISPELFLEGTVAVTVRTGPLISEPIDFTFTASGRSARTKKS